MKKWQRLQDKHFDMFGYSFNAPFEVISGDNKEIEKFTYLLEKSKLNSFIATYEQFNYGNSYSSGKRLIANSLMFYFINAYRHNPTFYLIK